MKKLNLSKCIILISQKDDMNDIEFIKENKLSVVCTGVGKLNSTITFLSSLSFLNFKPQAIINLGECRSSDFNTGDLVNPTSFIQEDMNMTELGYAKYQTPKDNNYILYTAHEDFGLDHPICLTSDTFRLTNDKCFLLKDEKLVYDNEAFAEAKVSTFANLNFLCVKYVNNTLESKVEDKNAKFKEFLRSINTTEELEEEDD